MEKRTEKDETKTRIKRMISPEGKIVVNPNRNLPRGKHLKKRQGFISATFHRISVE